MIDLCEKAKQLRQTIFKVICRGGGGHIPACLSMADVLTVLYHEILRVGRVKGVPGTEREKSSHYGREFGDNMLPKNQEDKETNQQDKSGIDLDGPRHLPPLSRFLTASFCRLFGTFLPGIFRHVRSPPREHSLFFGYGR